MRHLVKYLLAGFIMTVCSCNSSEQTEDFRSFLVKFSVNTEFQLSRVQFPLEYEELSENFAYTEKSRIEKEEWRQENLFYGRGCQEIYPQLFDNFEGKLHDTGKRLLVWKGIENGIAEFYYFKLIEGNWYLVRVENLST